MKKFLCLVLSLLLVLGLTSCMTTDEVTGESKMDPMSIILMIAMVAALYFMMIRPQNKQKKKEKELREGMEVGDGVTTIGGIVGRIVSIKEDTIVIETSADRTRIRFHKGAIQDIEKLKVD
jgi:preprotein translocase, YajC subunit